MYNPWRSLIRVIGFAAAAFVLASVPTSPGRPAQALSGNAGPISVSVSPTNGVGDGQEVTIHAEAPAGVVIYELKAHLCTIQGLRPVNNTYDFGWQGKRCANVPLGAGDVETVATYGGGTAVADLPFRLGVGSVLWVNDLGYDNTLTCGAGSPCLLVVQAQISEATVFFNAVVCYDCAPDGTPPGAGPAPPAEAPPPAADAGAAAGAAAAPVPADAGPSPATAGAAKKGGAAKTAKTTGGGTKSTSNGDASLSAQGLNPRAAVNTEQVSDALLSRRERVFIAALVGGLGCARIVHVMTRARRSRVRMA